MALQMTKLGSDVMAFGVDSITGEKGYLQRLINKTGAASVKGTVLAQSTSTSNAVELQTNEYDPICICAESGIADGALIWVWKIGSRCQVLMKDTVAAVIKYVCICADTDGRADNVAVPTGTPTSSDHWKEIGHILESKSAGTNVLVLVDTHYN